MSELAELERRITAALDRIGAGLEQMPDLAAAPAGDSDELVALREALADEKTANAQLEERVKTVRRKDEARIKELEDEVDDLKAAAGEAAAQIDQARKANQEMKAALAARPAEAPPADDGAVRKLREELQALRKVRDTDRAELDAILGDLKPLMEEQTHA